MRVAVVAAATRSIGVGALVLLALTYVAFRAVATIVESATVQFPRRPKMSHDYRDPGR